jgi:hypothetical protein
MNSYSSAQKAHRVGGAIKTTAMKVRAAFASRWSGLIPLAGLLVLALIVVILNVSPALPDDVLDEQTMNAAEAMLQAEMDLRGSAQQTCTALDRKDSECVDTIVKQAMHQARFGTSAM